MSSLRGFGFTLDVATGRARNWYVAADGVKRWANTDRPVEPELSPQAAAVERALRRAYDLGQTYAAQAESESRSQWKKAEETRAAFFALIAETLSAMPDAARQESAGDGWPAAHTKIKRQLDAALAGLEGKNDG